MWSGPGKNFFPVPFLKKVYYETGDRYGRKSGSVSFRIYCAGRAPECRKINIDECGALRKDIYCIAARTDYTKQDYRGMEWRKLPGCIPGHTGDA